jgi:hypothetical protein
MMFNSTPSGIPAWSMEKGTPTIPPPMIVEMIARDASTVERPFFSELSLRSVYDSVAYSLSSPSSQSLSS